MSERTFVPFDWTGLDDWKPDDDEVFYEHKLWDEIVLRAEVTSGGLRFWVGWYGERGGWHDLRISRADSKTLGNCGAILLRASNYAAELHRRWVRWMQANGWEDDDA